MARRKKAQKNRKRQVVAKTPRADTLTRRDVMKAGAALGTAVVGTVVGGQIVKYLPSPAPSPAPPARTVSIGILWGKPAPVQGGDGDIRIAQDGGPLQG